MITTHSGGTLIVVAATLALSAPVTIGAQQAAAPARSTTLTKAQAARPEGPEGFSIVLVLGEMQSSGAQSNVPAAAQKALADMKDFLPYKGYRLLDAQWTLCCGRTPVMTRMRGADELEYELELSASPSAPDNVNVRFELTELLARRKELEVSAASSAEEAASVVRLRQELEQLRARREEAARKGLPGNHPDVVTLEQRIVEQEHRLEATARGTRRASANMSGSRRRVIDASFRMDVGETVVVGTSRIQGGDKALIALLTAVPQRGAAK